MFGLRSFASTAFNSLLRVVTPTPPEPVTWGKTGGIKKHNEKIKKSQRAEMQEHLEMLFAEQTAEAVAEIKEEVKEYVKPSQGFSIHSIDYGKLAQDLELVQRIINKVQEIQQEQEDEALLLMLM